MLQFTWKEKEQAYRRGCARSRRRARSWVRLNQRDTGQTSEMIIGGHKMSVAGLRRRIEKRVGHGQLIVDADLGGGECDVLVKRNDLTAQRLREEDIRENLRFSE